MMVLGQYRSVLIDTWWYWVNMEQCWLIYDGTVSVEGGTGWYLVVLGQCRAVMVCTWWRCFSVGRVLSLVVLGGTESE